MGLRKPQNYSEKEISTALFGRALAHPVRVKIINLLNSTQLTLKDIGNAVNLSPTAVRNHIRILQDAELLLTEYKVHHLLYSLNAGNYRQLFTDFLDAQQNDGKIQQSPTRSKTSLVKLMSAIIGFSFLLPFSDSADKINFLTTDNWHSAIFYQSG